MDFGTRLKELRCKKKLTQAELAHLLDLKPTAISNYEANRNQPDLDKLVFLAKYFEVSCDYLIGVTDKYLPVGGEVLDKEIVEFFKLYEQMNNTSVAELKEFAEFLIYRQIKYSN